MGKRGLRNLRKSSREGSEPRYFEDYDRNDDESDFCGEVSGGVDVHIDDQGSFLSEQLCLFLGSGTQPVIL